MNVVRLAERRDRGVDMSANDTEIQPEPATTEAEPNRKTGKGGLVFALGLVLMLVVLVYLNMG